MKAARVGGLTASALAAAALAVVALAGTASFAPVAAGPAPAPVSLCARGETVAYSCNFGRSIGSVCAGQGRVHYRFGLPGSPAMDLANADDWSNVHVGSVVGQGGGLQEHVRFSAGQIHYTVFAGVEGSLADHPGRTYSGIAVSQGKSGEHSLATLTCKGGAVIAGDWVGMVRAAAPAPVQESLEEERDGPFDAWF